MADVAAAAGVAKITVSRALADSPLVRENVRAQVKRVAVQCGYRMNTAARTLRTSRTHSIAVVIEMDPSLERPMSEPFVLAIVGGLLQEFTLNGYRLVLTTSAQIMRDGAYDVDGLILIGQGANDEATTRIRELDRPMVIWGSRTPADTDISFVGSDNVEGGRLIGRHARALNRQKLLFLGDPAHPEVADRLAGLKAELGTSTELRHVACGFSRQAGMAATTEIFEDRWRPDCVIGASDAIALGARDALLNLKIRVPADAALIGYDDLAGDSDLTSVNQSLDAAGKTLSSLLLEQVNGGSPRDIKLPVSLKVRGSSTPS